MKPTAQPNLLRQMILAALLDNRQTTRTEIREKRGQWVAHKIEVPVPTLAGNVSELNCDRAAKRWLEA